MDNTGKRLMCIDDYACSGSGLSFVFLDTGFPMMHTNASLILYNVSIHNVSNFYSFPDSFLSLYSNVSTPILSGTGLSVMICSNSYPVVTFVSQLKVTESRASHAGSVFFLFCAVQWIQPLLMTSLVLENNTIRLHEVAMSPALSFLYVNKLSFDLDRIQFILSSLVIQEAFFTRNVGYKGAGIMLLAPTVSHVNAEVQMMNCQFRGNKAKVSGSAVYFGATTIRRNGRNLKIRLTSITAIGTVGLARDVYSVSVFSFVCVQNEVSFLSQNVFRDNYGSAIEAYSSIIRISESFLCENNLSNKGSCLLLIGNSFIHFYDGAIVTLRKNMAQLSGGAIYSDDFGSPGDICTIWPRGIGIHLTAEGNSALLDGDDMKISKFYGCSVYKFDNDVAHPKDNYKLFTDYMNYHPTSNTSLVSKVSKLAFCNNNLSAEFQIFPGVSIQLHLMAYDAGNHSVHTSVTISMHPINSSWSLLEGVSDYTLYAGRCNTLKISMTVDSSLGRKSKGSFTLQSTENPFAHVVYNMTFLPCPHGFESFADSGKCGCSSFLDRLNTSVACNIQNAQIVIPESSWFGIINNDSHQAFSFTCPPSYCRHNVFKVGVENSLCINNRTGKMCGKCIDGLSVVMGSNECHYCSNYFLFTLLVYALAGVLLVLFLYSTKLTISDGALGGIIFFSNISSISLHTSLLVDKGYVLPIKYMMAFLNLNNGFSVCLYDGMTMTTKMALQFMLPVYLCFIVLVLVICSRFSVKLANFIVGSSVQVLATVVHLSFANLLSTVADVLTSSQILYSPDYHPHLFWYFDGNVPYFTGGHLVIGILSVVIICTILLPYVLFTVMASYLRRYRHINLYLYPLIDTYHGPYKDNYGYWCGVRQCMMVCLYAVFSGFRGTRPGVMLMINIGCIGVFLILQILLKPFKSIVNNLFESWLMFLLCCTDLVTFFFLFSVPGPNTTTSSVIMIFLCSYLLTVFVVIIVQCVYSYRPSVFAKLIQKYHQKPRRGGTFIDDETREPLLVDCY